jgi:hypothetical protein
MRTNQKDPRYKDIGIKKCCANQVEIKQKVFLKVWCKSNWKTLSWMNLKTCKETQRQTYKQKYKD